MFMFKITILWKIFKEKHAKATAKRKSNAGTYFIFILCLYRLDFYGTLHGPCPTCAGTRTHPPSLRWYGSFCPLLHDSCTTATEKFWQTHAGLCPTSLTEQTTKSRKLLTVVSKHFWGVTTSEIFCYWENLLKSPKHEHKSIRLLYWMN